MNLMNGERFIKVFSSSLSPVNTFPMKATFNLSKFLPTLDSSVFTVKILRYTVII